MLVPTVRLMEPTMKRAILALILSSFCAQATGAAEIGGWSAAVGRAVLTPPPGAFAPRAARPAPAPMPAAAPSRWMRDLRVVSTWALETASAALREPLPAPTRTLPRAFSRSEERVAEAAPRPIAAENGDRIIILGGQGVIGAYGELDFGSIVDSSAKLEPYMARSNGYWSKGRGVSVKVEYLNPLGVNKADAEGFTLLFKGQSPRRLTAEGGVPPLLRREHPVYFIGDTVTVEAIIRNEGTAPLRGLLLETAQEGLMLDGSAGPVMATGRSTQALEEIPPGGEARARWTFIVSRRETRAPVSFEQTAVKVTGGLGEDGKAKVYADVHQAGIVDPPSP